MFKLCASLFWWVLPCGLLMSARPLGAKYFLVLLPVERREFATQQFNQSLRIESSWP